MYLHLQVVLALNGSMGRMTLSQWLFKIEIPIWDASEWNELTQILQELFIPTHYAQNLTSKKEKEVSIFIVVIDIGLLNLSTDIWKEQLNFLDMFNKRAKFAWVLNHDTSNTIKMELHNRGHLLMVNEPLYKAKMIQIIEAAIKENCLDHQRRTKTISLSDTHEFLEIDHVLSDPESSNESEKSEINPMAIIEVEETRRALSSSRYGAVNNCFLELTEVCSDRNKFAKNEMNGGIQYAKKPVNGQKDLEGVRILLAEDTPILQKVATIMLEKMGATVSVVGDGVQAVEALQIMHSYDLILMDCQVTKT